MIALRYQDGVHEMTLQHAPLNEIGLGMLGALEDAIAEIDSEKGHALIVHSGLERGFCAGADLKELYQEITRDGRTEEEKTNELAQFIERIHAVMNTLDTLPLTTISAIHGVCFGGGLELVLTTDLRIAEPTARFCFPELRLGVIPGFGGIPRLKRDVGNGLVRDLLLTGRSIHAKKALAAGLINQLVGSGESLRSARMMAEQAGRFDGEARRTAKRFIKPIPTAELEAEKDHFMRLAMRPPVIEALGRFVESDDLRPYLPGAR
jgi:enoyl-CoA hydratase/carnithine racemase